MRKIKWKGKFQKQRNKVKILITNFVMLWAIVSDAQRSNLGLLTQNTCQLIKLSL